MAFESSKSKLSINDFKVEVSTLAKYSKLENDVWTKIYSGDFEVINCKVDGIGAFIRYKQEDDLGFLLPIKSKRRFELSQNCILWTDSMGYPKSRQLTFVSSQAAQQFHDCLLDFTRQKLIKPVLSNTESSKAPGQLRNLKAQLSVKENNLPDLSSTSTDVELSVHKTVLQIKGKDVPHFILNVTDSDQKEILKQVITRDMLVRICTENFVLWSGYDNRDQSVKQFILTFKDYNERNEFYNEISEAKALVAKWSDELLGKSAYQSPIISANCSMDIQSRPKLQRVVLLKENIASSCNAVRLVVVEKGRENPVGDFRNCLHYLNILITANTIVDKESSSDKSVKVAYGVANDNMMIHRIYFEDEPEAAKLFSKIQDEIKQMNKHRRANY